MDMHTDLMTPELRSPETDANARMSGYYRAECEVLP